MPKIVGSKNKKARKVEVIVEATSDRHAYASARAIKTQERQLEAFKLRRAGATYQEIADRLGYADRGTVHRMVLDEMALLSLTYAETVDHVRQMEVARLDDLLLGLMRRLAKLDTLSPSEHAQVVQAALRIQERRARLLGLDKPTLVEHSGAVDSIAQLVMTAGPEAGATVSVPAEPTEPTEAE